MKLRGQYTYSREREGDGPRVTLSPHAIPLP